MAPHSSTLAWKILWTEEPGRLQSMGSLRVGQDWVTSLSLFTFHALEKEMATHSSILAWRIPGTGEPGGLLSMGSHRVGHDWSDLAAAAGRTPKLVLKWLQRARKGGVCLWCLLWLWRWSGQASTHGLELTWFKLLASTNKKACKLPYWLAQVWGKRGQKGSGSRNLSVIRYQK